MKLKGEWTIIDDPRTHPDTRAFYEELSETLKAECAKLADKFAAQLRVELAKEVLSMISLMKTFVVTEKQCSVTWGGGFWCKLCGHKFKPGDQARWIFAGHAKMNNFFVCHSCDLGDEATIAKAKEEYEKAVELAKRWGIYGPDWQKDARR